MIDIGNVFILGDSYSTFENYIPAGYASWYFKEGNDQTDVDRVEQTWWWQLLQETESNLVKNCSFSGTTICHTGYGGEDCSDKSYVARFERLVKQGYFKENKIDTFIVFGGTNDSWAGSPIGELKYSEWTKTDLYSVLPAFCYLLDRIKKSLPDTRLLVILNTDLNGEITEGFKTATKKYAVELIELKDIDKSSGHPNIAGMGQIKEQVLSFLKK